MAQQGKGAHVAVIVGISGLERYLVRQGEVTERKRARKFRSEQSAARAADEHIKAQPGVIQRAMKYRVEPT